MIVRIVSTLLLSALVGLAPAEALAKERETPNRIVSLVPSVTEILFAIGAGDQVVGVTRYCNYPPAATRRTVVGGAVAKTVNIERIVALRPDLVLSSTSGQQAVNRTLRRLDITVRANDPQSIEAALEDMRAIGRAVGRDQAAHDLVRRLRDQMAEIERRVRRHTDAEAPRVFYEVWDQPLITAGRTTFIHELIERAGGVNIFGDLDEQYPQVSVEEVIGRDPTVILGPDHHGSLLTAQQLRERPAWQSVSAVRAGRVHLLDGDIISRSGPRIGEALARVAAAIHPELRLTPTGSVTGMTSTATGS
jgi:iron complex transport system substrate-binding protein